MGGQLKVFDSSVIIIIDGTNKDRVTEVEKKMIHNPLHLPIL